jgi:glutathione S-transferase
MFHRVFLHRAFSTVSLSTLYSSTVSNAPQRPQRGPPIEEMPMITVHHLLVSQSERVIWLLEELGTPYELKSYPRAATGMADPIFQQLHPTGNAPVIQDGAVTLAESLAIFTYILDLYGEGKLRIAPGAPHYADFVYWFNYSNAGLMPLMMHHLFDTMTGDDSSMRAQVMQDRLGRNLRMIDDRLAAFPYIAGPDFTAADILMHFPFGTMATFAPVDIAAYPHIRPWLDRLSARPAYKKAMRLAGHETDPAQPGNVPL